MISRRVVLHFPRRLVDQPIICQLIKKYDLTFNILKASVTQIDEGLMVIEFTGPGKKVNNALRELKQAGVRIQPLSKDIIRDENKCTHCGACIAVCPTMALTLNPESRKVDFHSDKCIACELCISACPPRS